MCSSRRGETATEESLKYILVNVVSSSYSSSESPSVPDGRDVKYTHLSVRVQEAGMDGLMLTVALLY